MTITITCTDTGTHASRRLGRLDQDGTITTHPDWEPARDPETCPICHQNVRRPQEWWQARAIAAKAVGLDMLDISYYGYAPR